MPPKQKSRVNAEQEAFLYQICPRYHKARQDRTLDKFWPPIWDHWFLCWPVVPGLIERGALPPEAANYNFTPEQKKVVNAEMEPILEIITETMEETHAKWLEVKLAEEDLKVWEKIKRERLYR